MMAGGVQAVTPDLAGIYFQAMQARNQREQMGMQREQFAADQEGRKLDIQAKQQVLAANKQQSLIQEQEIAQRRSLATANFQKMAAQALQRDPGSASMIQSTAERLAQQGAIDPVQLPGNTLPEGMAGPQMAPTQEEAQQLGAQADASSGFMAPSKPRDPTSIEEKLLAEGLTPGSPEAQKRARALNERGGVNINVGGKELPVGAVTDLTDATNAANVVDEVGGAFSDLSQDGGILDRAKAAGASYVPGTDESNYLGRVNAAAQIVGLYLEGGKLGEADVPRYRAYFPKPGDSQETAQFKTKILSKMIADKNSGRYRGLKDAGYRVPVGPGPKSGLGGAPQHAPAVRGGPGGQAADDATEQRATRTDPATGETRTWNGSSWVREQP